MTSPGSARLEVVLLRAARDPAFRADLLARRAAGAVAAGFVLAPAERALLDSVDAAQLEAMLASLPPAARRDADTDGATVSAGIRPDEPVFFGGARPDVPEPDARDVTGERPSVVRGIRPGLPIALAAGAVLAAGAAFTVCATAGVRPDVPRPAATRAPADPAPATAPASAPAPAPDAGVAPPTRR